MPNDTLSSEETMTPIPNGSSGLTAKPNESNSNTTEATPAETSDENTTPEPPKKKRDWNINFGGINSTQKLFLVQQMEIMIRAGISLTSTLDTLREQVKNKYLKKILQEIGDSIQSGKTLAEALTPFKKDFGELMINMIEAGESSGRLDEVLGQVYLQMKKDHEIISRIKSALTYPIIVVIAMFGIGIFMITFIIPKLTSIFTESNIELPLPTKILIGLSDFLINNGILATLSTIAIVSLFIWTIRQPRGKSVWHKLLLHLPIFGAIIKKVNIARFARTVSSFLKTDIPIVKTLKTTANVLGNVHYKNALMDSAEQITKGITLTQALEPYKDLFNPTILQMINVGEETGALDDMLLEAANFYEDDVNQTMETLPALLEPLLMLLLGLGVGAMAVAVILPLYSLTSAF